MAKYRATIQRIPGKFFRIRWELFNAETGRRIKGGKVAAEWRDEALEMAMSKIRKITVDAHVTFELDLMRMH